VTSPLLLGLVIGSGVAAPPAAPPTAVIIATARGEATVPVRFTHGQPAIAARPLAALLPLRETVDSDWATVTFGGQPFRFLLGAAVVLDGSLVVPLSSGAFVERDTLFLPLQWLTDYVPRRFQEAYRYDPVAGRFQEAGLTPVVRTTSPPPVTRNPITGLRRRHVVTVDAGHGGSDPGTPCRFCPRGVTEKDVTLQIAKRLRDELERRGIGVTMTRSKDTLIGLFDRAPYCRDECDLFVSIHVDALAARPGYDKVSGIHTYFLGEALTEDARRVAALENEALRLEGAPPPNPNDPALFIMKHLQANEILRESALLAELVQEKVAEVHPGVDRGIQQNRLVVLTTAWRPAILIETGYGTNRRDAAFLTSSTGQQSLARSIADGIVAYLQRLEAKVLPEPVR
jgi:N-acetylmuramoyl-L-alanine amidase